MPGADRAVALTGVAPMFVVDDVAATAEWYRDTLGFTIGEYFHSDHGPHAGEEPGHAAEGEAVFVIVHRDEQRLMLGRIDRPGGPARSNEDVREFSSDAYFWVEGIEALYDEIRERSPRFVHELELQVYGLAEFAVFDNDGRVIRFGGPPAG